MDGYDRKVDNPHVLRPIHDKARTDDTSVREGKHRRRSDRVVPSRSSGISFTPSHTNETMLNTYSVLTSPSTQSSHSASVCTVSPGSASEAM